MHKIEQALVALHLQPKYDPHISPGTPFTDAIRSMITHAHLFIPIITENSQGRPWVHQETGYAMALNVPVLPVAVASLPEDMIAELQALPLRADADVDSIGQRLEEVDIPGIVLPPPGPPRAMVEIAEWMEDRTKMMAEYATRVMQMGDPGRLRQRGALSSFCLPDADVSDPIWRRRDGKVNRSEILHMLQRDERKALEAHARGDGCDLIIDPTIEYVENGRKARRTRLETLRNSLSSLRDVRPDLRVVTSVAAREGNLTIVGDWFVAESLVPRPDGYRQTVFSWHAPTVLRWSHRFDEQFGHLCRQAEAGVEGVVGPDAGQVIGHLDSILEALPKRHRRRKKGATEGA